MNVLKFNNLVDNYWPINYQKEKEKIVNSSDHIQVHQPNSIRYFKVIQYYKMFNACHVRVTSPHSTIFVWYEQIFIINPFKVINSKNISGFQGRNKPGLGDSGRTRDSGGQ